MPKRDYYEVLGVGKGASVGGILRFLQGTAVLTITEDFASIIATAPHLVSSEHRGAF